MSMEQTSILSERMRSQRVVQVTFAMLALASVGTGLVIYGWSRPLGLAEDTARALATAMLLAGIADTLVLLFWEKIFRA